MTAATAVPEAGESEFSAADPVVAELAVLLARLGELAVAPTENTDAARIDSIALLEHIKAAAAAAQHERVIPSPGPRSSNNSPRS